MDYDYYGYNLPVEESILSKKFKLESEIRASKQGDKSIDELYEVMVRLWDQIEKLEPFSTKVTTIYKQVQEQNHLVQFLLALRDEFEPVRKQLLSMIYNPSIEESVNLLKYEERKLYSKGKFTIDKDAAALSMFSSFSMNAIQYQDSGFAGSDQSRRTRDVNKREGLGLPESEYKSYDPANKVRILSYNVCFWDLELHKRMDALCDLIETHSPDVICLQGVTSEIYTIFSQSFWWEDYKSSLSIEDTRDRSHFCMQLSLLSITLRSFSQLPFRNSRMGRELCIAHYEVPTKTKSLIIATSHLESPTLAPPTYNQMNSEERVVQAKEALNHLHMHPNVVFCGDMNWDEVTDGNFPMSDGWSDAWTDLRPRENGWTYDTKSNQMLSANRPLQKRLDRFVCKMDDYKVGTISMVGTEAIPGVTYSKEKRVLNGVQNLQLPVFPSDHYGLLLKLHRK